MIKYRCHKDNIVTRSSQCPKCKERTWLEASEIFWCPVCYIPLFESQCSVCGGDGMYLTTDIRPVFPEERLLVEIILGKPFSYQKSSVWKTAGNIYFIDGIKLLLSTQCLREKNIEEIRNQYNKLKIYNSYEYFELYIEKFVKANRNRYDYIDAEAIDYIKEVNENWSLNEMFISFSGGKDSTVTADLVQRACATKHILHIFCDTTLEFPETLEYMKRYKATQNETPVFIAKNKDKDFLKLCMRIGPPSRVMRWCCTIFKTGMINKTIETLFRQKQRIATFYGVRRSESHSRSKYEKEVDSPKIVKQVVISPIIDWIDFDIWLYLLTRKIDFNHAYRMGYTRVGCWCCPNNSFWSEFLSKIFLPDWYGRFRRVLIDFADKIGKPDPEVYIDSGNWKARQGGNGLELAQQTILNYVPCAIEDNSYQYQLKHVISEELYEFFKPFGSVDDSLGNKRLGEVFILDREKLPILKLQGRIGSKNLRVTVYNNNLRLKNRNIKWADKIKDQLTKYQICIGCQACASICKNGAIHIKVMGNGLISYTIQDDKCSHCMKCISHYTGGCYIKKVLSIKKGNETCQQLSID